MQKRTAATALLSLALLAVSFAGFGNAYVVLRFPDFGSPSFAAIAVCYGIAAFVTAAGLWQQRTWALLAYITWAGIALSGMILFQVGFAQIPWLKFTIALIVFTAILWGLGRYVKRTIQQAL